ncbi:hypothetical protein JCM15519_17330 [Fundidesulfovibrio butyratiphilus]
MAWSNSPPRRCVYCGKVGARTVVAEGYAHRRCIPKAGRKGAEHYPIFVKDGPSYLAIGGPRKAMRIKDLSGATGNGFEVRVLSSRAPILRAERNGVRISMEDFYEAARFFVRNNLAVALDRRIQTMLAALEGGDA